MSNIQPAYTKILAQDDSTTVTGHYLGGNLANIEYIAVRQVGYLGLTSVTTCLACASNWRCFSTNALLVGDRTGGKYLLVSITDTAIRRKRVVVYKLVPQNNTWVHLTVADWFSYFKGMYRFKKWGPGVIDGTRLVATGYFDAMDSSIHIEDYPRTVVVDLENLDSESTDQTNSQTTREATKPMTEGKSTNEQFNEDSTMQADGSKSKNDKYTLLELQKHTDRVKVSRNGDIAVTVKRFGDITDSSTGAVVHIYKTDASEDPFYCRVQSFNIELSSRSRNSIAVNENGSIIVIGLPSSGTDGHGKVTLWHRCPGSARWKEWEFLDNGGKLSFGRNVSFTNKGILQVEYDCGYAYFDVQSGRTAIQLSADEPKEQPASDEFLDALKKKKEERVRLHQEGENMINLQRVRNTELEQEIDLLNNLIELYSKKKP